MHKSTNENKYDIHQQPTTANGSWLWKKARTECALIMFRESQSSPFLEKWCNSTTKEQTVQTIYSKVVFFVYFYLGK